MTCVIIAALVSCSGLQPVSPAAALQVLEARRAPYVYTPPAQGPTVVIVGTREAPAPHVDRRLDGTLVTDPPQVYGLPIWFSPVYVNAPAWGRRDGHARTR